MLVDFQVIFDEDIGEDKALSVLREATKEGTLATFKVEADSPHTFIPTKLPTTKATTTTTPKLRATSKRVPYSSNDTTVATEEGWS